MIEERKRIASEESLQLIIEKSPDALLTISPDGILLYANPATETLFERPVAEMLGAEIGFLAGGEESTEIEVLTPKGFLKVAAMRLVEIEWEGAKAFLLSLRDITARKKMEEQQRLAHQILTLLNRRSSAKEMIREVLAVIKKNKFVDAVAIRLRDGDDYPYFASDGFSEDFLSSERFLSICNGVVDLEGDGSGNPMLGCMCGNILRGRTNPDLPHFTAEGTFWTNCTSQLLTPRSEADRQGRTCNYCHDQGYESVALIPLRIGEEIIGLMQFNDHRPDQFTPEMILFFEGLASSIGIALSRERLQEKLSEEQTFTKKALNSLEDIFFVIDLKGRFLRWNKALNRVTGYLDPEIAMMNPRDFVGEADRERLDGVLQTALQQGSISLETLLVTKEGGQIPYDFNGMLLSDSHGRPIGFSGVGRDITVRKYTEHVLHERIKELGCINAISRLTTKFGLSIEEFVRQAVGLLPSGWQYPEICAARITLNSTEFKTANFRETEWRQKADILVHRKKFGTVTICYLEEEPTEDEGPFLKEERSLLDTITDLLGHIIEHRLSEAEIRTSEEKFRIIFDNTYDGILLADAESKKFHFANASICRMLGYSREEINNLGVMDIHPEKALPSVMEQFAKQFRNEISVSPALPVKRKGGSVFYADVQTSPVELSGKQYLLGIFSDITERQKLEAQLQHAQKMEAVGTLTGGIAHDFNNILNVIMGYGAMVLDKLAVGSKPREDMQLVLQAADKAAVLTRRLLVFSRKEPVNLKPFFLNELILELRKMLDRILRESIELQLNLVDLPLQVLGDAGLIEQVLMNLVTNARDAMLEGGRLTIGTGLKEIDDDFLTMEGYAKPGKYALITVADSGSGMDAETQKKIFEPFFTTKEAGRGSGLGLAISYGIIKQNHGYIWVHSKPGQGTVFDIFLPLSEETASPDWGATTRSRVKGGNETILIAEDDPNMLNLIRITLESFGYSVITAKDGEEALAQFMQNRQRINLLLLDMILPRKSGKEVAAEISKIDPGIKILSTSGYPGNIVKSDDLITAGFDFIQKPFPSQDLLLKVREVLDK